MHSNSFRGRDWHPLCDASHLSSIYRNGLYARRTNRWMRAQALCGPTPRGSLEPYFTGAYERLLLDGVGHFPPREAPEAVAEALDRHLRLPLRHH